MSARILVVDDVDVNVKVLEAKLTSEYFNVLSANDGLTALKLAQVEHPDLILLDVMMPRMDGLELCRRIRQKPALAHMYVVLLTGRDDRKDVVAGLDAGADDYIVKPFDPDELRARVQVGIRVLTLQEKLADRVAELQDALTNVKRLQGLLPICSYCKRIRGDDQYWQQVDSYIVEHSDAQFTHGICPPCSQKLMAEIEEERIRRQ